jgi:sialate O-acetylesterase
MAAALDYGDTVAGVHTRYKKPIAERAVLAARAVAYGESGLSYSGPVAQAGSATIMNGGKYVSLKFATDNTNGGGLVLRNSAGFQFCNRKNAAQCMHWSNSIEFTNATSVSLGPSPDELLIKIPPVIARGGGPPGLIRYAWDALPCNWPKREDCAVYSKGGLPAPPFMLFVGPESEAPSPLPPCLAPAATAAEEVSPTRKTAWG